MIELTFWEFWGWLAFMGFIGLIGGVIIFYLVLRLKDEIKKYKLIFEGK